MWGNAEDIYKPQERNAANELCNDPMSYCLCPAERGSPGMSWFKITELSSLMSILSLNVTPFNHMDMLDSTFGIFVVMIVFKK